MFHFSASVCSSVLHYNPNSLIGGISAMYPVLCSAFLFCQLKRSPLSTSRCPATPNTNSNRREITLQTDILLLLSLCVSMEVINFAAVSHNQIHFHITIRCVTVDAKSQFLFELFTHFRLFHRTLPDPCPTDRKLEAMREFSSSMLNQLAALSHSETINSLSFT